MSAGCLGLSGRTATRALLIGSGAAADGEHRRPDEVGLLVALCVASLLPSAPASRRPKAWMTRSTLGWVFAQRSLPSSSSGQKTGPRSAGDRTCSLLRSPFSQKLAWRSAQPGARASGSTLPGSPGERTRTHRSHAPCLPTCRRRPSR